MHLVFVYGTLKENGPDDFFVRGHLYSLGWFPGIKLDDDYGDLIPGQIKEVNDDGLARMDQIEGHPNFYCRKKVKAYDKDGKELEFQPYVYEYEGYVGDRNKIDQWVGAVEAWDV